MTKLNLTTDAQKLYQSIENLTPASQALVQQASEASKAPMSVDQVAAYLLATCPAEQQAIQDAVQQFQKDDCKPLSKDGSKLIELMFQKNIDVVGNPRAPRPTAITPRWDPMLGTLFMDKDVAFAALCNAADWQDGGTMRVMHMIGRDGAIACGKQPDLAASNLVWDSEKNKIQNVGDKTSVVKFEDKHDEEFEPGDSTAVIFFDKNGKETKREGISDPAGEVTVNFKYTNNPTGASWATQVYTGAQADAQNLNQNGVRFSLGRPVKIDQAKVQAYVQDRSGAQGAWTSQTLKDLDVTLFADRGLHREPGSRVMVSFLGAAIQSLIKSEEDKFRLAGNKPQAKLVDLNQYQNHSVAWLLGNAVNIESRMIEGQHADSTTTSRPLRDVIFADAVESIQVGQAPLVALGDGSVPAAEMKARGFDAYFVENEDGKPRPVVELEAGFLSSKSSDVPLKGWRIDVGYRDTNGAWQGCESFKIKNLTTSEAGRLELPVIEDYGVFKSEAVKDLELQVYNANGVPAQRLRVALDQLEHREDAMPECKKPKC